VKSRYSHVADPPFASSLEWQSRGTYGRNHQSVGEEDAWEAPLSGYRELQPPLTQTIIRASDQSLRDARGDLEATHQGALYFPFALSDLRPVRATQGYLVKFPAALIDSFKELAEIRQSAVDEPGDQPPRKPRSSKGGSSGYGRQRDVERRLAVEAYSVGDVKRHYEDTLGYNVENVGSREAWDLTARKGAEELHIEVKGSTMDRLVIDVTDGEVRHAEDNGNTMLIVIDHIQMDSQLACSGGRWRYWSRWVPDRTELIATAYRHPLPPAAVSGKPRQ